MSDLRLSGFADEIAPEVPAQIAGLAENRLGFVEVRGVGGKGVLDLSETEVVNLRDRLREAAIGVSAIGSPIGKVAIRSDLGEHFARFEVALERARQLGTRYVRLFSFYHEGETAAAVRGAVVEQLARMARRARQQGITLLHENEKDIYGDVPRRCLDLVESVNSPHLRLTFDPANFVQCGVGPLAEAWPLLAPHTEYFHIKDAVAATGAVVPAGYGDAGIEAILGKALAAGFDGFLSLEPHLQADDPVHGGDGAERFAKAVAALRQVLARLGHAES